MVHRYPAREVAKTAAQAARQTTQPAPAADVPVRDWEDASAGYRRALVAHHRLPTATEDGSGHRSPDGCPGDAQSATRCRPTCTCSTDRSAP